MCTFFFATKKVLLRPLEEVFGRCVTTPPVMRINIQMVIMHGAVECKGGGGVYCVAKATPISLPKNGAK